MRRLPPRLPSRGDLCSFPGFGNENGTMTVNGNIDNEPKTNEAAAAAEGSAATETPLETMATNVVPPGSEDLEALLTKAAKADEHWERILRMTAEMDNFKKRAARDRQEAIKFANENLLQKLLPTLDNFEMAMAAANSGSGATVESIRMGVAMILSQLRQVLGEAGLEEIDATGQPFNPAWHEAVSQQDSTEVPEGQVLQQVRKGYKLRERLLRAAAVIVARQPVATPADGSSPVPEGGAA